jgi:hypothetical protein
MILLPEGVWFTYDCCANNNNNCGSCKNKCVTLHYLPCSCGNHMGRPFLSVYIVVTYSLLNTMCHPCTVHYIPCSCGPGLPVYIVVTLWPRSACLYSCYISALEYNVHVDSSLQSTLSPL